MIIKVETILRTNAVFLLFVKMMYEKSKIGFASQVKAAPIGCFKPPEWPLSTSSIKLTTAPISVKTPRIPANKTIKEPLQSDVQYAVWVSEAIKSPTDRMIVVTAMFFSVNVIMLFVLICILTFCAQALGPTFIVNYHFEIKLIFCQIYRFCKARLECCHQSVVSVRVILL